MVSDNDELILHALVGGRRTSSGWVRANCPFCAMSTGKPDRRQSLGIKPSIAYYTCFKCGARGRFKGSPEDLVISEPEEQTAPAKIGPPDGFESLGDPWAWDSIFLRRPVQYLSGRGIPYGTVLDARIGAVLFGKWGGRIVVPVLDVDQETWLGFSARDWTNEAQLRYRYPAGMQRGKLLYNQAAVYVETSTPLLVVEGVFDALPYWPDAVACLGKPGAIHREILLDARRPIAVCLDGDAHEEGWALAQFLTLNGKTSGAVRLPPQKDPNTVEPEWLKEEAKRCLM